MTDEQRIVQLTEMVAGLAEVVHNWHRKRYPELKASWRDCDFGACKVTREQLAEIQEVRNP